MTKTQMFLIKCDVNILRFTKINGKSTQSYRAEVTFIVTYLFFKA